MQPAVSKKALKAQKGKRQICSMKDAAGSSAPAILSLRQKEQHAKPTAAKMAQAQGAAKFGTETETGEDPVTAMDPEAITRPILEAINANKAELMGHTDHLSAECTLIRHDLDKIRRHLSTVEMRVSEVKDTSHTQGAHLSELRDLVRSLQHRADNAEDRQRRNNIWVVGLPEGAEGDRPTQFAELLFKQLLSLQDLPPMWWKEPTGSLQVTDPREPSPGPSWSGFLFTEIRT